MTRMHPIVATLIAIAIPVAAKYVCAAPNNVVKVQHGFAPVNGTRLFYTRGTLRQPTDQPGGTTRP
jgi:hypothetical protein